MENLPKIDAKGLLTVAFDRALTAQQPLAKAHVARLRRVHPDFSPQQLVSYINKQYLGTVTVSGTGAGAAAVVPNGVAQGTAAVADLITYLESSIYYVLCLTEAHDLDLEDVERRRLLVTSALLGNSASTKVLNKVIGKAAPYWGKMVVDAIPMTAIKQANKVLGPRFITKWGTKTGVLVLGKQVPLMIGAAIGGGGNLLFGTFVIEAGKKILGPPPAAWQTPTTAETAKHSGPGPETSSDIAATDVDGDAAHEDEGRE